MELRHNGACYHVNPWGPSWDDVNYYLVGYDSDAEKIQHYRVDIKCFISDCQVRNGKKKSSLISWIWLIMRRKALECSGEKNRR